jgi:hypothetical protein
MGDDEDMAEERDSLLREVDEELRREQMEKLWQKYSGLILGAATLVVLLVAGYKFLETRRIAAVEAGGAEFQKAISLSEASKNDEAAKAFEDIAKSGPKGYAALAKLHVAGAQIKAGKEAEALATYEGLANDAGADPLLKNFAQLQAASLRMGQADFTEMQNRLNSLTGDSSPYKVTARELLGFAAYKAGKTDEARKLLEPLLIDPAATRAIQERIKIVMADIASKELVAAQPSPAAKAEPAAAGAEAAKPEATKAEPAASGEPAQK